EREGVRQSPLSQHMKEVQGKKIARLLSPEFIIIGEVGAEEVEGALRESDGNIAGIVIDRVVDQKLLDNFASRGLEFIAARDFKGIIKRPSSIKLLRIG
ncbi:MAG: DNA primase, partial [Methanomicrobiales archaeon]|nr:DNA primase [Methanomicrobiales archaeon]